MQHRVAVECGDDAAILRQVLRPFQETGILRRAVSFTVTEHDHFHMSGSRLPDGIFNNGSRRIVRRIDNHAHAVSGIVLLKQPTQHVRQEWIGPSETQHRDDMGTFEIGQQRLLRLLERRRQLPAHHRLNAGDNHADCEDADAENEHHGSIRTVKTDLAR